MTLRESGRVLFLMAVLALPAAALAAGKAHTITIEGMKFAPERLEVAAGDTITWTNKDLVPHTASAGKALESGTIPPNGRWKTVVRKKGEIDYTCRFHPGMRGVVVVK